MLLKYPELLWGLLALTIPILVHLLQLRKFRKTPFTNVRVLQRLRLESDRTSKLKKWLLLLTRLGIIAALVLAFAQPYKANPGANNPRQVAIYLDNSFSMEAPSGTATLLQKSVQQLLQSLPEDFQCAVLTNTEAYPPQQVSGLRDPLLNLEHSYQEADLASLQLRARSLLGTASGTSQELWLISDFNGFTFPAEQPANGPELLVAMLRPEGGPNMSLDSAFIRSRQSEIIELQVDVRMEDPELRSPLSLYNGDTLIAKTSPEPGTDGKAHAVFSLPAGTPIEGAVRILDEGLPYDNALYFHLGEPAKIRVLSIGPGSTGFLRRIYTEDEFIFRQTPVETLDFVELLTQDVLLLNGLETLPESLLDGVRKVLSQGGTVAVIPDISSQVSDYNRLLRPLAGWQLDPAVTAENRISRIRFEHPLFQDVFEGETQEFENPTVQAYFPLSGNPAGILEFQNGAPYLVSTGNLYLFTAPLEAAYTTMQEFPLIVPIFYAMARLNRSMPELYFTLGQMSETQVGHTLGEDAVFTLESREYQFIPQQQRLGTKTALRFSEEPRKAGIYTLQPDPGGNTRFAFNYPRPKPSEPFADSEVPEYLYPADGVENLLEAYQNSTRVTELWKWFVIFALLFAAAEVALQKLLR